MPDVFCVRLLGACTVKAANKGHPTDCEKLPCIVPVVQVVPISQVVLKTGYTVYRV